LIHNAPELDNYFKNKLSIFENKLIYLYQHYVSPWEKRFCY